MGILINHTNHPSASWSDEQRQAALAYGEIMDIPFPSIAADLDEAQVQVMAEKALGQMLPLEPSAVLVQGEFTYSYALIKLLQEAGITVLAACSERQTVTTVNAKHETVRQSVFSFVQFRSYGMENDGEKS